MRHAQQIVSVFVVLGLAFLVTPPVRGADPQIDHLLQSPVGKDWVANGGNLTNQRYSTLNQIDTSNVKQLKGAWVTHLKGSGLGGKYSLEATPIVKDGIMYVTTGNDDVFALNAKTGEIQWERWSGINQSITSVCCGWDNRGVAIGEGLVFLGQLDANVVALDIKTGKEVWKTQIEDWHNGYGITSAPLYYDGIVYIGITGGEYGVRGRLTALDAKTGKHVWHFQEVHHDLWDYDAASPVVLFDTVINGQPRKGIAEAGRTGWVYILDRTNGKPLVGIVEKAVPQEPRQHTAKTQPYPIGDAVVPQCAKPLPGYETAGCIFQSFWETPVLIQPSGIGGTNWAPMSYDPQTGSFYVPATVRTSAFVRYDTKYMEGQRYDGGTQAAPIGSTMSGTFTAIGDNTNKIVWQNKMPYRIGQGSGSATTAGGLVFHGEPDGNVLAFDAKTGDELWRFQTGYGADAPPAIYEVDGQEYVAIATGGNQGMLSKNGDAVWVFSLNGQLAPQSSPPPPQLVAGPAGPVKDGADTADTVKIGAGNMEYVYSPGRVRVKAGTTLIFTNAGDTPHTATAFSGGKVGNWDTGALNPGQSKKITFDKPGSYFYICTLHPWMYGQVIVQK
jgi:quinohemoprotein ethanol dehydrogenase